MPGSTPAVRFFVDPEQLSLRSPTAIIAFGGWIDAGTSGTGSVRFLVNQLNAQKLADIDPEEFYSFTDTRPLASIVGPGQRAVHWPRGEFYAAPLPEPAERDLVLFVAPEPNLKWRTFSGVMLDVLQQTKVREIVTIGSIFGAVDHRAAVPLTGWATEPRLRAALLGQGVSFTSYEGPTGFVTVLLAEAQARAVPACALFGFAPNYVQGVPNPRVSYALLRALAEMVDAPLPLTELERAGSRLVDQVDQLLSTQPDLREQVDRMLRLVEPREETRESETPSPQPDEPPRPEAGAEQLPSPQAFVKEMEEYLKQLRRENPGQTDQNPSQ